MPAAIAQTEVTVVWDLDDTLLFQEDRIPPPSRLRYELFSLRSIRYAVPQIALRVIEILERQPVPGVIIRQSFFSAGSRERNHAVLDFYQAGGRSLAEIAAGIFSREHVLGLEPEAWERGYGRAAPEDFSERSGFSEARIGFVKPLGVVAADTSQVLMIDDSLIYARRGEEGNWLPFTSMGHTIRGLDFTYARILGAIVLALEARRDQGGSLAAALAPLVWRNQMQILPEAVLVRGLALLRRPGLTKDECERIALGE